MAETLSHLIHTVSVSIQSELSCAESITKPEHAEVMFKLPAMPATVCLPAATAEQQKLHHCNLMS